MDDRQEAVLEWVAAGCLAGEEPVERYKQTAASPAGRGLIQLDRGYEKQWRACLTPPGRYWIEHRSYPPAGTVLEPLIETGPEPAEVSDSLSDAEFINRRRIMKAKAGLSSARSAKPIWLMTSNGMPARSIAFARNVMPPDYWGRSGVGFGKTA